jgi:hypothetical protein
MDGRVGFFLFFAFFFTIMSVIFMIRHMNRKTTETTAYQPRMVVTAPIHPPQIVVTQPATPVFIASPAHMPAYGMPVQPPYHPTSPTAPPSYGY